MKLHQTGPEVLTVFCSILVAHTETGKEFIIYSDKSHESEEKCKKELNEIYKDLLTPIKIRAILDAQTEDHLKEIRVSLTEMKKIRQSLEGSSEVDSGFFKRY